MGGRPFIDLTGQTFGRLVVVERVGVAGSWWLTRCVCGGTAVVHGKHMRTGATASCGCLQRERTSQARHVHGSSGSNLYAIWKNMHTRCFNPSATGFHRYGGRGITICDRWRHDFAAFASDMGARPSPRHSIDRINPDGHYSPENCRWATPVQQRNNRSTAQEVRS